MMKNLVIVESPAKAKKIEEFLGKDYTVKSSYGHIRDLSKNDMSIDVENNYEPEYQISDDKRKLVSELQKAVSEAEQVWLASDEDREGEAIAWHLQETLKLDKEKTKRIVFNEITENALKHAIENPRKIDMNLVDAQQARRVLDRLVGYEISPILWSKIKPALSAGRVQSVAVRLIVEREREIKKFESESYFKITAEFRSAEGGTIVAEIGRRIESETEATKLLKEIGAASWEVSDVDKKPAHRSPAPPFTTSTLQQEASRKLGYSVARTMQIAQQLYESGFITYMRTDSVNLSELALKMASEEICNLYGERYLKTRRYHTKTKGAQEAHEAIRPTNLANQTINADVAQRRLYELIWKRTIASQMADAEIEKTNVEISSKTVKDKFVWDGEQIMFDGFFKVYSESSDDEEDEARMESKGAQLTVSKGQTLTVEDGEASQHYTQHPPRYTEASLVKKLEELGIGRPSTYAPTISTILKREYVSKEDRNPEQRNATVIQLHNNSIKKTERIEKSGAEKGKLVPTDIGTVVNDFLMQHFTNILDYNFTATVEKNFDEIAAGSKAWRKVIDGFYRPFHKNIETTQKNSHRSSGERLIGVDPKSGKNVYAKIGRYGTLIQVGDTNNEEKPKFASMKKGQSIETITLEEALSLFSLPRTVGKYDGKEVIVSIGKFGPYVRLDNKFYSLSKSDDPYDIDLKRCIEIINTKREAEKEKEKLKELFPHTIGDYEEAPVCSNVGKYGPYLTYRGENFKLPKESDPMKVTLDEAVAIITNAAKNKKTRGKKK
ncbi:MAG: type I DNA topoisomerase [Bacteroidales bacterium]|nr:type I DNA topoisomerase [Bacteroidales bacterium]